MGVNGQVLTPQAGSRTRVLTLTTNAPFDFDNPVDYGINKICDECQICVRRCPSGAIPGKRKYYRGIEKSKLNTARCFPVVAQAHGCAICMKVCPVQRYGLEAVRDEYVRTGRILGKDTEELEAYTFQGKRYGPGARPILRREWFHPEGFPFDPERKLPLIEAQRDFG
jgi:epoxyqueuosine reductase QueG